MYKAIPFSAMSAVAGWMGDLTIPSVHLRKMLFGLYARVYGCKLEEAEQPIERYASFGDFFARGLRPGVRQIARVDGLVAPSDGTLLHCGSLRGEDMLYPQQVKGSLYALEELIGAEAAARFQSGVARDNSAVYYCTIYLSPGDYHRFHAPARLQIAATECIPGERLSVAPWMMRQVPKLLCMNKRVAINGRWKFGQLSMVPVGAANVGTIEMAEVARERTVVACGTELGRFRLGSTVVLVFEGPRDMEWRVQPGARLALGEPIIATRRASWWGAWWK